LVGEASSDQGLDESFQSAVFLRQSYAFGDRVRTEKARVQAESALR
jgi:hypothetical protein